MQFVKGNGMPFDMPPKREPIIIAIAARTIAVEGNRTYEYVAATDRTLVNHRCQRKAVNGILFKDSRENTTLAVVATIEYDRMSVKVCLHLMRLHKAVAQNPLTVELAGGVAAKAVLTSKAFPSD